MGGGSKEGVRSYLEENELELGLELSLGGGAWRDCGRILTAKDFPSVGTKRGSDSVSSEGASPPRSSQVVGWPPIAAHRMNNLINQTSKSSRAEEESKAVGETDKGKEAMNKSIYNGSSGKEKARRGFVKVNMDGVPIGRKVDLSAHPSYESLALSLEDMFFRSSSTVGSIGSVREKEKAKSSKLLDGSSDFVLTYEDKEGDWMLVGDVPWRMFLSSVRRLRIMRTSEANGLVGLMAFAAAPRHQERDERQRNKPV